MQYLPTHFPDISVDVQSGLQPNNIKYSLNAIFNTQIQIVLLCWNKQVDQNIIVKNIHSFFR